MDASERVRARLVERERGLSPFAQRSETTSGRGRPEEPSPLRMEYQRDRDRIIHTKSFRRLKHKTQVFIAPEGDHFATRLTHTLEVAQIARTIARALNLNEDLTEAIALGHDLGHSPFGHAGEEGLASLLPGGFRHNEQSLRVVDLLERRADSDVAGLNLTWEVREGILKHSKPREGVLASPTSGGGDIANEVATADWAAQGWGGWLPSTLEGQIVRVADSVAYLNHDIADAVRAGLLTEAKLPARVRRVLGVSHSQRIDTLVTDIVETSWAATGELGTAGGGEPRIEMSRRVLAAMDELRDFMFENVYLWEGARAEAVRARRVIAFLLEHFARSPEEISGDWSLPADPAWRRAADYVAGMTDRFALDTAVRLGFEPRRGGRPAATRN